MCPTICSPISSPLGWEHVDLTGDYVWGARSSVSGNSNGLGRHCGCCPSPSHTPVTFALCPLMRRQMASSFVPALLPSAMMFSSAYDVFPAGQFEDQWLVQRREGGEVEGLQTFDGGEPCGTDPSFHHAALAVDQFEFRQTQKVARIVEPF